MIWTLASRTPAANSPPTQPALQVVSDLTVPAAMNNKRLNKHSIFSTFKDNIYPGKLLLSTELLVTPAFAIRQLLWGHEIMRVPSFQRSRRCPNKLPKQYVHFSDCKQARSKGSEAYSLCWCRVLHLYCNKERKHGVIQHPSCAPFGRNKSFQFRSLHSGCSVSFMKSSQASGWDLQWLLEHALLF